MTQDDQTIEVYNAQTLDYAKMVQSDVPNPQLDAFLAQLPAGGDVLDLGCGPGHAAARMCDNGFAVTATDASPEMAAMARAQFGLTIRVASFADLRDDAAFDGVWASFSLLHAPKSDIPGHLAAIHRALRPGGLLCIGLKTGEGEARDRLGRFYAYYSDAEITGLLGTAGFTVTARATGAGKGLEGTIAPWIVLIAHG